MKNLGIAVKNVGSSHLSYALMRSINLWMAEHHETDIIVFYEELAAACLPVNCAMMQINEMWGFDGPVVATSLSTAAKLINSPSPSQRLFYVWDVEWARLQNKSYERLQQVYGDKSLTLLTRGRDYARLLDELWGRPDTPVIEDFDIPSLLGVINDGK